MVLSFQLFKKVDCIIYIEYHLKKLGKKVYQYGIKYKTIVIKDIKRLENVAEGFKIIKKNHDEINCETCILAKQLMLKRKM